MSEPQKFKLEDEHFDYFKSVVNEYIDKLDLNRWDIRLIKDDFRNKDLLAATWANSKTKCAEILINKEWEDVEPTKEELKTTAVHEVLELLLWELGEMGKEIYNHNYVSSKKHDVINVLQNII